VRATKADLQKEVVALKGANARLSEANARLSEELGEALQQQTATADVLKTISRSTFDLQPVLDTLTGSAARLCGADYVNIWCPSGDGYKYVAGYQAAPEQKAYFESVAIEPGRGTVVGRTLLEGKIVEIADTLEDREYKLDVARMKGYRTQLGVPMLRDGRPIGVIVFIRTIPKSFTNREIALASTFADQAVIAIENVRLSQEVQTRTEELSESLAQQTATADVLKTISRSTFDLQTVLQTLVESAARVCDAERATITRQKEGAFYLTEFYGFSREFVDYTRTIPIKPESGSVTGRALLEGQIIHIPDVEVDPEYTWSDAQRLGEFRTIIGVPMLREGVPIGVLSLARSETRPFTEKQIELVSTFADQAAIAIETANRILAVGA
jgi:two-component system, NtrC family, sensor kinase